MDPFFYCHFNISALFLFTFFLYFFNLLLKFFNKYFGELQKTNETKMIFPLRCNFPAARYLGPLSLRDHFNSISGTGMISAEVEASAGTCGVPAHTHL